MAGGVMFRSCCCGCTLKTGTILISLWYQAASLVQLATMAYRLDTGDYMGGSNDQTLQRMFSTDDSTVLSHPYLGSIEVMYTYPLLVITLVMNVFEVLTCAMLLYGAVKERSGFVLPWVIVETIVVSSSSVLMVQVSAAFLADKEFYVPGVIGLLVCCVFVLVNGYLILVVYSFYRSLRQQLSSKQILVNEEPADTVPVTKADLAAVSPKQVLHLGESNYAYLSEA